MEFTNWAPGYPSSSGGDCVRLARSLDNQWLDVDCSTQNMFVCESGSVPYKDAELLPEKQNGKQNQHTNQRKILNVDIFPNGTQKCICC